jgi:hypothetical protein
VDRFSGKDHLAMGWIDIAIPGLIGLWLIVWPRAAFKPTGDEHTDAANVQKFRRIGGLLLAVAVGYYAIKIASMRNAAIGFN